MKCPICRKHRIRIKESESAVFTVGPYKVKYCIGCGWEKTIQPKDMIINENAPETAPEGSRGVQTAVAVESLPVEAPEVVAEPVTAPEPEKKGFLSRITGIFVK